MCGSFSFIRTGGVARTQEDDLEAANGWNPNREDSPRRRRGTRIRRLLRLHRKVLVSGFEEVERSGQRSEGALRCQRLGSLPRLSTRLHTKTTYLSALVYIPLKHLRVSIFRNSRRGKGGQTRRSTPHTPRRNSARNNVEREEPASVSHARSNDPGRTARRSIGRPPAQTRSTVAPPCPSVPRLRRREQRQTAESGAERRPSSDALTRRPRVWAFRYVRARGAELGAKETRGAELGVTPCRVASQRRRTFSNGAPSAFTTAAESRRTAKFTHRRIP